MEIKMPTKEIKEEIKRLYVEEMLSGPQISRKLEISAGVIYRCLKAENIDAIQLFGGPKRK
jgi:predicted transcriptional regulator